MESRIDLAADLNDEDDEGLGWSTLSEARDPSRIRPGVMPVAGNRQAQAVVRVVAVDDDGPGSRLFGGHSASPVQEGNTVRGFPRSIHLGFSILLDTTLPADEDRHPDRLQASAPAVLGTGATTMNAILNRQRKTGWR
jgi:hypothetical protein